MAGWLLGRSRLGGWPQPRATGAGCGFLPASRSWKRTGSCPAATSSTLVEDHAAAGRAAPVKPEDELVQVGGQVRLVDRPLVSAQQPPLGQRGHPVHGRQQLTRSVPAGAGGSLAAPVMRIAQAVQPAVALPRVGDHPGTRLDLRPNTHGGTKTRQGADVTAGTHRAAVWERKSGEYRHARSGKSIMDRPVGAGGSSRPGAQRSRAAASTTSRLSHPVSPVSPVSLPGRAEPRCYYTLYYSARYAKGPLPDWERALAC